MVEQFHRNWEEQGDIRVHTFKYDNVLKTEFYIRLDGKWSERPFVVIGIKLTSLIVFFRCSGCLWNERWKQVLKARPERADFCRGAAFRVYNREVNGIREALGFPEREAQ